MAAPAGWYDAETRGRQRWWDGTQWTPNERATTSPPVTAAPPPPPYAAGSPVAPQVAAAPTTPIAPAMGWYPTAASQLRWWDGRRWTGMRVKDGRPGVDWATIEPVAVGWIFGGMFLLLGIVQLLLGFWSASLAAGQPLGLSLLSGLVTVLLGAFWIASAVQSTIVQRIPTPTAAPRVLDAVRPLPGEQEGPGAGWHRVSGQVTRWWTGTRWSQYTGTRFGVRPTFHGARSYRLLLVVIWCVIGLGALAVIVGIVLAVIAGTIGIWEWVGGLIIAAGVVFAIFGGLLLFMAAFQRKILLPPKRAPQQHPV